MAKVDADHGACCFRHGDVRGMLSVYVDRVWGMMEGRARRCTDMAWMTLPCLPAVFERASLWKLLFWPVCVRESVCGTKKSFFSNTHFSLWLCYFVKNFLVPQSVESSDNADPIRAAAVPLHSTPLYLFFAREETSQWCTLHALKCGTRQRVTLCCSGKQESVGLRMRDPSPCCVAASFDTMERH